MPPLPPPPPQPSGSRPPPFDAVTARRLREALELTHAHVAYGIRTAYGIQVGPASVAAWERGEEAPTEAELMALAGALWCSPGELLGAPGTLREHRMASGVAPTDLALRIGMDPAAYERAERTGRWTGDDRQTAALTEALELPLPAFTEVTGRADALAELLRRAVTTRWQAYVKPVAKLLPVPRKQVAEALRELHSDYQSRMVATLTWDTGTSTGAGAAGEAGEAGHAFLDDVPAHFWARLSPRGRHSASGAQPEQAG